MKSGYQTTEFWMTILTVLIGIFGKKLGISETEGAELAGQVASGIVTAIYIISRFILKKNAAPTA